MSRGLDKLFEIQRLYATYNRLVFEKDFLGVKPKEDSAEVLENMKIVAKELRDEFSLDEFDFSSNYEFLKSVKEFCTIKTEP